MATVASGRSMEKFATLDDHQGADLAGAEGVEQPLPLGVAGRALDDRRLELLAELLQLVEVGADHQRRLAGVPVRPSATTGILVRAVEAILYRSSGSAMA